MANKQKSVKDIVDQYYRLGSKLKFNQDNPRFKRINNAYLKYKTNIENSNQYKNTRSKALAELGSSVDKPYLSSAGNDRLRRDVADGIAAQKKMPRNIYMGKANNIG